MIKNLRQTLMVCAIMAGGAASAQHITSDFSWTNTTGSINSDGIVEGCEAPITVKMKSSALGHVISGTSAYFPEDPDDGGDVTITIDFSAPVYNLRLLLNDFDEFEPGGSDDTSPSEYGTGFSPAFQGVDPAGGTTFVPTGTVGSYTGVDPAGGENTKGWVYWTGGVTSVSFTYVRDDAGLGEGGWGLLIDAMEFDCREKTICSCREDLNYLSHDSPFIPDNGATEVYLHLNSGGQEISKLNVSIPNYTSLVDPGCIKCDPENISSYGKIHNLPVIAGATPWFAGFGTDGASEIVYEFATPVVIDQMIKLQLQFPPVVDLTCCKNEVDYCVKVGMIDENCRICETTVCVGDSKEGHGDKPKMGAVELGSVKSRDLNDGISTNSLNISPNPASDFIQIELPSKNGEVVIYAGNGKKVLTEKVTSKRIKINTSSFDRGTYIVKFISSNKEVSGRFVKN